MGRSKKENEQETPIVSSSPLRSSTIAGMENELIMMAYEETARRIRDHKASSPELVHFLKMGSENERLVREKLEAENNKLRAQAEAIQSVKTSEETIQRAIEALTEYSGNV